jgi:Ca-activated chloride channel family protein
MLDELQPKRNPDESQTNLSDAIAVGLHRLRAAGPRRKVMVLLTDGEHNVIRTQSGWLPREAARVAAGLEVPIYTLDAGGSTPGNEAPVRDRSETPTADARTTRNEAVHTLEDIARITGGRMFSARDTAGLLQACRAIDQLERTRVQSFLYRRYYDGYPWLSMASFVLLVSALALDMTFWRRLP